MNGKQASVKRGFRSHLTRPSILRSSRNIPSYLTHRDPNVEHRRVHKDDSDEIIPKKRLDLNLEDRENENSKCRFDALPSRSRWLPTQACKFQVYCDDNQHPQTSCVVDSKQNSNYRKQEEVGACCSFQSSGLQRNTKFTCEHPDSNEEQSSSDDNSSSSFDRNFESDSNSDFIQDENIHPGTSSNQNILPWCRKIGFQKRSHHVHSLNLRSASRLPEGSCTSRSSSGEINGDVISVSYVYCEDMYRYKRYLELERRITGIYLMRQDRVLTSTMRYDVINWMCQAGEQLEIGLHTFHLAVAVFDGMMEASPKFPSEHIQLLAVSCLLISSKFQDTISTDVKQCVKVTNGLYNEVLILKMERLIFATLNFNMLLPTSYWFGWRLIRRAKFARVACELMYYFLELALLDSSFLQLRPSMIAASSFYLVLLVHKLQYFIAMLDSDIDPEELIVPAKRLLALFHEAPVKENFIFLKYGTAKHEWVSLSKLPIALSPSSQCSTVIYCNELDTETDEGTSHRANHLYILQVREG
ncbi:unnamed protein product [Thelazia callipaeda]|uniref:Cyclin N-terminal domain-containing protein n=1 Tax=Thelazia callipaeda TaxID=103827 RepID=A0A0N5CNE7_THECL|nr:unnamed protein product [Thelazia callipaeda]